MLYPTLGSSAQEEHEPAGVSAEEAMKVMVWSTSPMERAGIVQQEEEKALGRPSSLPVPKKSL